MGKEQGEKVERRVSPRSLQWPVRPRMVGGDGSPLNQAYEDFRDATWDEAEWMLETEQEILGRIAGREDSLTEQEEDELYEERGIYLEGLDEGVATAVVALSAAGCVTVTSCNGKPGHHEDYPLVVFGCRQRQVPPLLRVAELADCGLVNTSPGLVMLYANNVRNIVDFARRLIERRDEFDALVRRRGTTRTSSSPGCQ